MNLLQETENDLIKNKRTPADVLWVGSSDGAYAMPWAAFAAIARGVDYSDGFGSQEIARDIVVVGRGWWLERGEYDGSEWWDYKTGPRRGRKAKPFSRVTGGMLGSLAEQNAPDAIVSPK